MTFKQAAKDLKTSIRLKYNRRREFLRNSIERFIYICDERLDKKMSGRIYKRKEVELLLEKSHDLLKCFPPKKDRKFNELNLDVDNFDDKDVNSKSTNDVKNLIANLKDIIKNLESIDNENSMDE